MMTLESELKIYTMKAVKINLCLITIKFIRPTGQSIYSSAETPAMHGSVTETITNIVGLLQPEVLGSRNWQWGYRGQQ